MMKKPVRSFRGAVVFCGLAAALAACGGGSGGGDGGSTIPPPTDPPANSCEDSPAFASTFEAIQTVIFEKRGCTQQVCHGSAAQGGLNLSPDVAYENIFEKPALSSSFPLITPGDRTRSYLFHKVSAATDPGSFEIAGAPMPNGLEPLTANELEALRLWIYAGAPKTGTVGGTETLLDACLPEPKPIIIEPLDPPAPGTGFQFVMPQWDLEKKSEHELCFATYYDITDQVPEDYRNNGMFRFKGFELRQDPQSHHLILYYPTGNFTAEGVDVNDPSFGAWTCAGGEQAGAVCDPKDPSSCGSGLCRSEPKSSFACIGYGPESGAADPVGGAQQAQAYNVFLDGVFGQLPMKGVLYWNTHAFNLTTEDTVMNGRLNYLFADSQKYPINSIFDASRIFAANAAPYTEQTVCNDHVMPQGSRLFEVTSHTHKHGKKFTVDLPDGSRIYESFVYNDPLRQQYRPAARVRLAGPRGPDPALLLAVQQRREPGRLAQSRDRDACLARADQRVADDRPLQADRVCRRQDRRRLRRRRRRRDLRLVAGGRRRRLRRLPHHRWREHRERDVHPVRHLVHRPGGRCCERRRRACAGAQRLRRARPLDLERAGDSGPHGLLGERPRGARVERRRRPARGPRRPLRRSHLRRTS